MAIVWREYPEKDARYLTMGDLCTLNDWGECLPLTWRTEQFWNKTLWGHEIPNAMSPFYVSGL